MISVDSIEARGVGDAYVLPPAAEAREAFARTGLVLLRRSLQPAWRTLLADTAIRLVGASKRRDLLMPQSGYTPRHMAVIGGRTMAKEHEVMALYRSTALQDWISEVVGGRIRECPNSVEHVIMTKLERDGDEHGWHLDDYEFALISVVDAPNPGDGGELELDRGDGIERIDLRPGDAYLMRTDRIRHRVAPVRGRGHRLILNFTYSLRDSVAAPNGSAELLCD